MCLLCRLSAYSAYRLYEGVVGAGRGEGAGNVTVKGGGRGVTCVTAIPHVNHVKFSTGSDIGSVRGPGKGAGNAWCRAWTKMFEFVFFAAAFLVFRKWDFYFAKIATKSNRLKKQVYWFMRIV